MPKPIMSDLLNPLPGSFTPDAFYWYNDDDHLVRAESNNLMLGVYDLYHPAVNGFWRGRGDLDRSYYRILCNHPRSVEAQLPASQRSQYRALGHKILQIDSPFDQLA